MMNSRRIIYVILTKKQQYNSIGNKLMQVPFCLLPFMQMIKY